MNKSNPPYLSVVIPLYNEEKRLNNLPKIFSYLQSKLPSYEVVLVNDGSIDKTYSKLKKIYTKNEFNLISYEKNRGKGFAIKNGMLEAKGKYKMFIDIDLSTPIDELEKFIPLLGKHQVIIGSRKMKGSNIKQRQPILRETLGVGFTILSKSILSLQISDFTCGFKVFSKKAAKEIFERQRLNRWGFDCEILFIAKKLGYKIKEVPIVWSNDPKSKVKFPHDLVRSLSDLLRIKLYDFRNFYQ